MGGSSVRFMHVARIPTLRRGVSIKRACCPRVGTRWWGEAEGRGRGRGTSSRHRRKGWQSAYLLLSAMARGGHGVMVPWA
jgi:hypothetical protein